MSSRRTWRDLVAQPDRCTFSPVPNIVLNGDALALSPGTTVAALVASLGLDPRQVAVERNREIVPRATYERTELIEGDRLEVVTFVGGG